MPNVLTVTELNELIKDTLNNSVGEVVVQGEVSGFKTNKDKLVFFELKDKKARVLCFLLKWELKVEIEDGMEVQICGTPSLFQASGAFHIRVAEVVLIGSGALNRAFELLKSKLEQEGLFDIARKRILSEFPESIGIITSKDGAACTDILKILNNRWGGLKIFIADTMVQGAGAGNSIIAAIEYFNKSKQVEVIILARGGGSLEDLQTFNLESVARAIFSSKIPIICGVGHERDVTIADLVADVRASTPTNAAMIAVHDRAEILDNIEHHTSLIDSALNSLLDNYSYKTIQCISSLKFAMSNKMTSVNYIYDSFQKRVINFRHVLLARHDHVRQSVAIMESNFKRYLADLRQWLSHRLDLIHKLNPVAVLARGYSITYIDNQVLQNSSDVDIGKTIRTVIRNGEIRSEVISQN